MHTQQPTTAQREAQHTSDMGATQRGDALTSSLPTNSSQTAPLEARNRPVGTPESDTVGSDEPKPAQTPERGTTHI